MSKKIKLEELNFDNPTNEETAEQQRMADEIMLQKQLEAAYPDRMNASPSRYSLQEAGRLLSAAGCVRGNDLSSQISWLRKAGYTRVHVKGTSRRVPLEDADPRHVNAMYRTELKEVRKVASQSFYKR